MVRPMHKTSNQTFLLNVFSCEGDIYKHYAIENEVNGESILIEEPKPGLWEFQPNMKLRDIGCEITFYGHSDLRFDLKFTTINHRPQCDRQMHLFPGNFLFYHNFFAN